MGQQIIHPRSEQLGNHEWESHLKSWKGVDSVRQNIAEETISAIMRLTIGRKSLKNPITHLLSHY